MRDDDYAPSLFAMRIPNRVHLFLAADFLLFAALFPLPPGAFAQHLMFGFGMLVVAFVATVNGWAGGGATKLNAVVALWLGPSKAYAFFVFLTWAGAIALWSVDALLRGRAGNEVPVGVVGVPVFCLVFSTTPMWTAISASLRHFL